MKGIVKTIIVIVVIIIAGIFLLPLLQKGLGDLTGAIGGGLGASGAGEGAGTTTYNISETYNIESGKETSQILEGYTGLSKPMSAEAQKAYIVGKELQTGGASYTEIAKRMTSSGFGTVFPITPEKTGLQIAKEQGITPVEYIKKYQSTGGSSGNYSSQNVQRTPTKYKEDQPVINQIIQSRPVIG